MQIPCGTITDVDNAGLQPDDLPVCGQACAQKEFEGLLHPAGE